MLDIVVGMYFSNVLQMGLGLEESTAQHVSLLLLRFGSYLLVRIENVETYASH